MKLKILVGTMTSTADYVAQAILWSSNNREAAGKILHLCSGPRHAIPIKALQREIAAAFRARGIRVPPTRIIPRSAFRAMLLPLRMVAPPRIRRAINTAPIFLDYLASEQVFHNEATNSFLRQSGIAVPPPSAYLGKILNFYLDRRE